MADIETTVQDKMTYYVITSAEPTELFAWTRQFYKDFPPRTYNSNITGPTFKSGKWILRAVRFTEQLM